MVALIIILLFIFASTRAELSFKIHNLEGIAVFKITFFHLLPFSIRLFNSKEQPLKFKYKIFGKTRNVPEKKVQKKIDTTIKKLFRDKKKASFAFHMATRALKRIKVIDGIFYLGIRERADTTAILIGCLNGFFIPALNIAPVKKTNVIFIPVYTMDVFEADIKCIISFSLANIIHESIGYLFKRRN